MRNPRKSVDNLRERIAEDHDLTETDRELLLRFSDRIDLLAEVYGDYRHLKLLGHAYRIATGLEGEVLAPALEDREAAERIVAWIHRTYDNEETNVDYRIALRVFARRVAPTDRDEIPPSVSWVSTTTSRNYDPSPDPREMLRWEEHIVPMAEASTNDRDAALITLGFDAGARSGELMDLSVGDIEPHEYGLQVVLEGKTGRRSVLLVPSAPYVRRWVDNHPRKGEPDAPLWCTLGGGDTISYQRVYQILKRLAKRADVNKNVTPTILRKSSAAHLARNNLNQVHIEDHHGWVRGSRVASRYIATFGEATDREVARVYGVEVDQEEVETINPVECVHCGQETPGEREFCLNCGQAISPDANHLVEEVSSLIDEEVINTDERERREDLMQVRRTVKEKPELLTQQQFHQLLNSLSRDSAAD